MALNSSMTWYNRVSGVETNGGGFDPAVSGAGTNYADQDAPQLSFTDLTSTNSTTVTSAAQTFTSAMVGNVIRIASGTGATTGYYTVMTYVDANTVTVDRVSGTYTAGVAKLGGAHATLVNYSNGGGGLPTPAIASPAAAGHTIYIRSAGSAADPSIAGTADYDYSAGYWTFPAGSASGRIRFIGLGASEAIPAFDVFPDYRPLIKMCGLLFYGVAGAVYWDLINLKSFHNSPATYTVYGLLTGALRSTYRHSIHDVNGNAAAAFGGINSYSDCIGNWIKNTGTTTGGQAQAAIDLATTVVCGVFDNLITDVRGPGVLENTDSVLNTIVGNIIANAGGNGMTLSGSSNGDMEQVANNTLYNCAGDAINMTQAALSRIIVNNTASKIPSGKFAYKAAAGTAAENDRRKVMFDYNNAYLDGGAGGLYSGINAGAHDTNVDPQFTDAANFDFSVGTNLKATGIGITPLI